MQINKKLENGTLSVSITGRLDTTTAPQLLDELACDGVTGIAFDLAGLDYISSAGIRVFLTAQKRMSACNGKMTIANPNSMVKSVFDITGCSDIFTIL